MKAQSPSKTRHNPSNADKKIDNSSPLGESTMNTTPSASRNRRFDESETTSIETSIYSENSISMSEYRILNPQTAEVPTLTQSRVLAAVLERVRIKEARRARRAVLRQQLMVATKNAILHPWQQFLSAFHHAPQPAMARVHVPASGKSASGVRVTPSYLALPRA